MASMTRQAQTCAVAEKRWWKRPGLCWLGATVLAGALAGCDTTSDARHPDPYYGVQPAANGSLVASGGGGGAPASPGATVSSNSVGPIPSPQNPSSMVQLTLGNQPPLDANPDLRNLQIGNSAPTGTSVAGNSGVSVHPPVPVASPGFTPASVAVPGPGTAVPLAVTPAINVTMQSSTGPPSAPTGAVSPGPASGSLTVPANTTAVSQSSAGSTPSVDDLTNKLKAAGMTTFQLSPSGDGFSFQALFEDKAQQKVKVYEGTGPTAAGAMQAVLDKVPGR